MAQTTNWALVFPTSTDDVRPYEDDEALAESAEVALDLLKSQVPTLPKRGSRATNGTPTGTSEQPYMRIDDIPVVSGEPIRIWSSPMILNSTVAGDLVQVFLRGNTAGVATTGSTQITLLADDAKTSGGAQKTKGFEILYIPSTTGMLSLLISYARASGVGSGNVNIQAASDIPCQLNIDAYNGPAPANDAVSL